MDSAGYVHALNFCRKLSLNAVLILVPLHFLGVGYSGWQIGLAVSLFAFAPLLFAFPTGWLNDRLSIREIVHAGLATTSLVFLLLWRVHDFFTVALLFLLLGVANNALDVSLNALYFKTDSGRDLNYRYSRLAFWQSLGTAFGTLLGGMLVALTSFEGLFVVMALFLLVTQAFVGRLQPVAFTPVPLRIYKHSFLNRRTLLFSVMIFFIGVHWGVEGTVYSPFLRQYFNLDLISLSLYISLALFGLALSAFLIGLLRHNPRLNAKLFLLSLFLSGIGLILMVNRNLVLSFFFRLIHEVGDGFLGALVWLFISRLFEKANIGGSAALLLVVMTLGHMAGSMLFASIGFHYGLVYPFYIGGFLLVGNALFGKVVFKQEEI